MNQIKQCDTTISGYISRKKAEREFLRGAKMSKWRQIHRTELKTGKSYRIQFDWLKHKAIVTFEGMNGNDTYIFGKGKTRYYCDHHNLISTEERK